MLVERQCEHVKVMPQGIKIVKPQGARFLSHPLMFACFVFAAHVCLMAHHACHVCEMPLVEKWNCFRY